MVSKTRRFDLTIKIISKRERVRSDDNSKSGWTNKEDWKQADEQAGGLMSSGQRIKSSAAGGLVSGFTCRNPDLLMERRLEKDLDLTDDQ